MKKSESIQFSMSEKREQLSTLLDVSEKTDEQRTEINEITKALKGLESDYRAALLLEGKEAEEIRAGFIDNPGQTSEERERLELRSRVSLARMLKNALEGKQYDGAEEEFRQISHCDQREIPLSLFDVPIEQRADAVTGVPNVTGISMQSLVPSIFSHSLASRIGIEMPSVPSGQYSIPRIKTDLSAGTMQKGKAREASAATFEVISTTPHRISARLQLTAEDISTAGIGNFEGGLRENLSMALSKALDLQLLNGDGSGNNISGLISQFTSPTDPTQVVDFSSFVASMASAVDGKFAVDLDELRLVVNPEVFKSLASIFMEPKLVGDKAGSGGGTPSVSTIRNWAKNELGSFMNSKRMPASASNIGTCLIVKAGMLGTSPVPMASAVAPVWGNLAISDPFSQSAAAISSVTMHVLVGNVLLKIPGTLASIQ